MFISYYSIYLSLFRNIEDASQKTKEDSEDAQTKDDNEIKQDSKTPFFPDKNEQRKEDYLFADLRYEYLDRMPPFQVEITSKLYETCIEHYTSKEICTPNKIADIILQKLQAVLCSKVVSDEVITEAHTFLALNENMRGYMSLKSILLDTSDALQFLLEACPQCLLQFGKVSELISTMQMFHLRQIPL